MNWVKHAGFNRKSKFAGRIRPPAYSGLIFSALALLTISFVAPQSPAQSIEILLVNGKTGKPMVGPSSYVNVWIGKSRKGALAVRTNENGIARLTLTTVPAEENIPLSIGLTTAVSDHPVILYGDSIRIQNPFVSCATERSHFSWLFLSNFHTDEILNEGYVSPNICGKAVINRQPGRLVLFVRPLTVWEALKS